MGLFPLEWFFFILVLNVPLNYLFIFIFNFGFIGAFLATIILTFFHLAVNLWTLKKSALLPEKFSSVSWKKMKFILKNSIPEAIRTSSNFLSNFAIISLLMFENKPSFLAYSVLNNLQSILVIPLIAHFREITLLVRNQISFNFSLNSDVWLLAF